MLRVRPPKEDAQPEPCNYEYAPTANSTHTRTCTVCKDTREWLNCTGGGYTYNDNGGHRINCKFCKQLLGGGSCQYEYAVPAGGGDRHDGVTITKAPYPVFARLVCQLRYSETRTVNLNDQLDLAGMQIIEVQSGDYEGYFTETPAADGSKLTLKAEAEPADTSATVRVTVRSTNYEDFSCDITVNFLEKYIPDTELPEELSWTYDGQPVPNSAIRGTASFEGKTVSGRWEFVDDAPVDPDEIEMEVKVEEGITEVPEGLKNIPALDTPAKLETAMRTAVTQTGVPTQNTAVYDVTLMVSTGGGRFGPNDTLTRAEAAAMLMRYLSA